MYFYIIRHGQTDWNLEHRVQGCTDVMLNATGIRQAEAAGRSMSRKPIDKIFCSDLKRAEKTAQTVRELHEGDPIPMQVLPELEEVQFGAWEGKTLQEVEQLYPEEYNRWKKDVSSQPPVDGEDQEQIRARVRKVMKMISEDPELREDSVVLLVSHGAIISYLIRWLLRHAETQKRVFLENGSISLFHYDFQTKIGKCIYMNDVNHL